MSAAKVTGKEPYCVDLQAGKKYYLCRCDKSSNQPFCDGSHKDSGKSPLELEAGKDGPAYICGCGSSANMPFCDGSHKEP